MEMYYNGALVMPNNYAVVNEEEMTYVEGGGLLVLGICVVGGLATGILTVRAYNR